MSQQVKVLILTLFVALILVVIGFLSGDVGALGNSIILATFIVATPQLFFTYEKYRDIKNMEARFPTFLRDMIEQLRSGVPLHKAIISTSNLDYGPLSKEIKKISHQLSWGMPLDKAMTKFADRMKPSKRLYSSVRIINESYKSGGDVVSMLESVADNATLLGDAENERKSMLNEYVLLMYAVSLIFIVIVVAINKLLIPIFSTPVSGGSVGSALGISNPCANSVGFTSLICGSFGFVAQYVFSLSPTSIAAYYVSLFFLMAMIQSGFSGLVAGQISENSIKAGIRHSLILLGITFGAFTILLRLGLLGV